MLMECHLFWKLKCLGHLIVVLVVPCVCHMNHDHLDNQHDPIHYHHRYEANSSVAEATDPHFFLHKIFEKYGQDGVLTRENFDHYLKSLGLHGGYHMSGIGHLQEQSGGQGTIARLQAGTDEEGNKGDFGDSATKTVHSHNLDGRDNGILVNSQFEKCRSPSEILQSSNIDPSMKAISPHNFTPLCPVILYELGLTQCVTSDEDHHSEHHKDDEQKNKFHDSHVFLYSTLAVFVISVSGILCVAIVPIIQRFFYHHFLHFFIALAIGSLTGDALLHLLPHAMTEVVEDGSGHSHDHHQQHNHNRNVWIGLTCLGGMCVFYVIERLVNILTQWRQKGLPTITVESEMSQTNGHEKVTKSRHNSQGFDYDKVESYILQSLNKVPTVNDEDVNLKLVVTDTAPEVALDATTTPPTLEQQMRQASMNNASASPQRFSSVIRTDHTVKHHGHAHSHTHHKELPATASALAWMVIAGDGLHNFSDGMAIGAAFASSLVVGLSTSIAVFCHELPHELGDFALLLKAGMKVRQALLYNTLSSILCFFGMLLGLYIGNITTANSWVFAAIAGMFLYIALVDMVPEMNSESNHGFGGLTKFSIQALGFGTGVAVMGVIAIYESDLQSIFNS